MKNKNLKSLIEVFELTDINGMKIKIDQYFKMCPCQDKSCFYSLWSQKLRKMKNQKIEFRCTLFEKKLLKVKAKKAGLTLSEFCRKSANDKVISERLTEDQITVYKMLIQYHNYFKSIGNLIKNKHPDLYQKVFQTADEIKNHLNNFK